MAKLIYDTPLPGPSRLGFKFESQLVIDTNTMTANITVMDLVAGPAGEQVPSGITRGVTIALTLEDIAAIGAIVIPKALAQGAIEAVVHLEP
jgi:hypothetical protein